MHRSCRSFRTDYSIVPTSRPLAPTLTRPFLVPGPESPAGIQTMSCQHHPPHYDVMPALVGQSERPKLLNTPWVATFILSFQLPTPGRTHPFWSPVRHVRLGSARSYTSHHALRSHTRLSVERWSVSATCIAATDHFAPIARTHLASPRTHPYTSLSSPRAAMHHAAIPHTRLSSHPLACNLSKKSSEKKSKNNPIADGYDIAPQAASGFVSSSGSLQPGHGVTPLGARSNYSPTNATYGSTSLAAAASCSLRPSCGPARVLLKKTTADVANKKPARGRLVHR